MQQRRVRVAAVLVVVAVAIVLGGCTQPPETAEKRPGPVKLATIPNSKVKQVTLTDQAVKRIGLEMVAIADEAGTRVVPYAAVVYDEKGGTYVFTSPAALTFVRAPITVARITADKAYLTDGPSVGTNVVTTGTAELYGAEQGIGY